jgi:HD superfamily phosphohydrolase
MNIDFQLPNKIIRDSLHGYINIPSVFFDKLIDTPIFQRLKRIEQTSMRSLYPSAHHDRFIHSLGVYHLGKKALDGLLKNISTKNESYYLKEDRIFWKESSLLFQIACLLHDCGHAPFSHSFEYAYFENSGNQQGSERMEEIKTLLKENMKADYSISNVEYDIDELFLKKPAPHEVYGVIIIKQCFYNPIEDIYNVVLAEEIATGQISGFSAEQIQFIQRCILGMKYAVTESMDADDRKKANIRNCLIQLLNSSFDVDKLDYIIRDSAASGIDNMSVDVERILNALTIVERHEYKEEVQVDEPLDNSVCFDKINAELKDDDKGINNVSLELNNVNIRGILKGYITITEGNLIIQQNQRTGDNSYLMLDNKAIKGYIEKGKIVGLFNGTIGSLPQTTITEYKADGQLKCKISGKISGDIIGKIPWQDQGNLVFEIGFKKGAMSIIEDTIIARNRLYLWTYAHHKVTYIDFVKKYALLLSLLDPAESGAMYEKIMKAQRKFAGMLSLECFTDKNSDNYLVDDNEFLSIIRRSFNKNKYAEAYLSRTRKHALWKTFAEYNMYFSDFSPDEKKDLKSLLFSQDMSIEEQEEGIIEAYDHSILKQFDEKHDFVWIKPSGYKLSEIDFNKTYIVINGSVKRLKDTLVNTKVSEKYAYDNFFYLYTSMELRQEEIIDLIGKIKSIVREKRKTTQGV